MCRSHWSTLHLNVSFNWSFLKIVSRIIFIMKGTLVITLWKMLSALRLTSHSSHLTPVPFVVRNVRLTGHQDVTTFEKPLSVNGFNMCMLCSWVGKSLTTELFSPSDSELCGRNSSVSSTHAVQFLQYMHRCVCACVCALELHWLMFKFGLFGMTADTCALVNEGVP